MKKIITILICMFLSLPFYCQSFAEDSFSESVSLSNDVPTTIEFRNSCGVINVRIATLSNTQIVNFQLEGDGFYTYKMSPKTVVLLTATSCGYTKNVVIVAGLSVVIDFQANILR